MKKIMIMFFALLFSYQVNANSLAQYKQMVANNLVKIDAFKQQQWRFKRLFKNSKVARIEIFDPSASPAWQLISINGNKPSQADYDKYNKAQRDLAEKKQQTNKHKKRFSLKVDKVSDLVLMDTLSVVKVQDSLVTMAYTPYFNSFKADKTAKFKGTLLLDVNSGQLISLQAENISPLKPNLLVKLERFALQMKFMPQSVNNTQHLVIHKVNTTIQGKLGYVKSITDKSEQIYSNYRFIGANIVSGN